MKREIDNGQNLGLCRKLTIGNTKVGDAVIYYGIGNCGDIGKIVYVSITGKLVIQWYDDADVTVTDLKHACCVAHAPLCWVENKPVYVGDVLYRIGVFSKEAMVVTRYGMVDNSGPYVFGTGLRWDRGEEIPEDQSGMYPSEMTWTKPVIKVKKSGWLNIYPNGSRVYHSTREEADSAASIDRTDCVECHWEEEQ